MTDGIGRIGSGNTSGIGGYFPNNSSNANVENKEDQQNQPQVTYTPVDESEVWNFLTNNSYFVAQVKGAEKPADVSGAAAGMEERAADCMPNFELAFALIQEEFGAEVATMLMNDDNFVDKLLDFFG